MEDTLHKTPEEAVAMSEKSSVVERPAPELNFRSAVALAGTALAYFCTVGFLNAFGVFQQYYTSVILRNQSNFQISMLGSFATFCIFACAPIAGLIADKWGPTFPLVAGAIVQLVAIFMISLCKKYYQFFLAQGLLLGVGMSFVTLPASTVCPKYFRRHRAVALGISVGGSSLGGVIWPIACDQFLHTYNISFAWTMRILGFMMIPLLVVVAITVRPPPSPEVSAEDGAKDNTNKPQPKSRKELRREILRPPFLLLCTGLFLGYLGFFVPFFYVPTYAVHLGFSEKLSFYLVSILNSASLVGRILPGFAADRWGRFTLLFCSASTAAVVAFCWTSATSVGGVVVWVLAYGFCSGAIMSLQFACAVTLVGIDAAGAAVGAAMGMVSLAGLFGTPIAGQLLHFGYIALACWSGGMLTAAAVMILLSRLYQNRTLMAKV